MRTDVLRFLHFRDVPSFMSFIGFPSSCGFTVSCLLTYLLYRNDYLHETCLATSPLETDKVPTRKNYKNSKGCCFQRLSTLTSTTFVKGGLRRGVTSQDRGSWVPL